MVIIREMNIEWNGDFSRCPNEYLEIVRRSSSYQSIKLCGPLSRYAPDKKAANLCILTNSTEITINFATDWSFNPLIRFNMNYRLINRTTNKIRRSNIVDCQGPQFTLDELSTLQTENLLRFSRG